jgi:hypothetical protein
MPSDLDHIRIILENRIRTLEAKVGRIEKRLAREAGDQDAWRDLITHSARLQRRPLPMWIEWAKSHSIPWAFAKAELLQLGVPLLADTSPEEGGGVEQPAT